jgi:HTH-type transcriptional regulator/antitoxin HigA
VKVIGGTVTFWINRENQYRAAVGRLRDQLDPEIAEQFLRELPLNDMIQMGWIQTVQELKGKAAACLQFFGVADVDSFRESYADVLETAFRTSPTFKNDPAAVAAWLRQGELEAAKLDCAEWHPNKVRGILDGIRELTRERDPRVFLPELQRRCTACGVAVLVIKAPKGCRASGAVRTLPRNRRMILLSARYLTDDHFWFTFFHETGHLLLHECEALLLEGMGTISEKEENEANEFSSNILIPSDRRQEMLNLRFDAKEIMRFAKDIGVSRGVVVGQLQHAGKIKHGHFRNLKFSFQWD